MKIILLEGIASSGKTTIERLLAEELPNSKVVTENVTLMDLIDNRDSEFAVNYLTKLLKQWYKETIDYLIVDRFHLTHAFRTHVALDDYSTIESELLSLGEPLLVLLTINENSIKERIEESIEYRKDNWKKGVQGTIDEKTDYYTNQQNILLKLQRRTELPTLVIDTTEKKWDEYLQQIKSFLFKA